MPQLVTASLKSLTAYSQSGFFQSPIPEGMTPADFEINYWREKMHATPDGHIFIPPMGFKFAITEAAKRKGRKIPGRGNATYGKRFEAGILIMDPVVLQIKADDVDGEWINANSDGVRGSGKRVKRRFPVIPEWEADVRFWITDPTITQPIFEESLIEAGQFIGIGRFRPENGGYYGRFTVESFNWDAEDTAAAAAE